MGVQAIEDPTAKFLWGPDPGPSSVQHLRVELYFCRHLRFSRRLPIELLLTVAVTLISSLKVSVALTLAEVIDLAGSVD